MTPLFLSGCQSLRTAVSWPEFTQSGGDGGAGEQQARAGRKMQPPFYRYPAGGAGSLDANGPGRPPRRWGMRTVTVFQSRRSTRKPADDRGSPEPDSLSLDR